MNDKAVEEVISKIRSTAEIPEAPKRELIERLESLPRPLETDPWIYRMVVLFLGLTVLVTVLGGIILTWVGGTSQNFQIPQGVVAIGSAAVGALAGLLAPSPRQS
jgi:hypothetical protein